MNTIWKYHIPPNDNPRRIPIPKDGIVVHVEQQFGIPTIWVLVNPENPLEERIFTVAGTGHQLDDRDCYLGTVLCDPFVWHILARKENKNDEPSS